MIGIDRLKKLKKDSGDTIDPDAQPERIKDGRAWVDEYLAGMKAVKDGTFAIYFINLPGGSIQVTPENVDDELKALRLSFGEQYPELFDDFKQA
jgi:hypothetical protein